MTDRTRVLNGAAPAAGKPGMGAGNVPFAPGLMSGKNLGQQTNPTPLARQAIAPPRNATPQTAPAPAPKGQPPAPGRQQPQGPGMTAPQGIDAATGTPFTPPGMPGPTNPWPQIYYNLLESWLAAIVKSAEKPLIGGMY
jgi:hypothetical protein